MSLRVIRRTRRSSPRPRSTPLPLPLLTPRFQVRPALPPFPVRPLLALAEPVLRRRTTSVMFAIAAAAAREKVSKQVGDDPDGCQLQLLDGRVDVGPRLPAPCAVEEAGLAVAPARGEAAGGGYPDLGRGVLVDLVDAAGGRGLVVAPAVGDASQRGQDWDGRSNSGAGFRIHRSQLCHYFLVAVTAAAGHNATEECPITFFSITMSPGERVLFSSSTPVLIQVHLFENHFKSPMRT